VEGEKALAEVTLLDSANTKRKRAMSSLVRGKKKEGEKRQFQREKEIKI